jgi:hypothetical protein
MVRVIDRWKKAKREMSNFIASTETQRKTKMTALPYQGIDIEAMRDEIEMMRREIDQLYSFNGRQPLRMQLAAAKKNETRSCSAEGS